MDAPFVCSEKRSMAFTIAREKKVAHPIPTALHLFGMALVALKEMLEYSDAEPDCQRSHHQHDRRHDDAKFEIIQR